jgi:hypothetical protein
MTQKCLVCVLILLLGFAGCRSATNSSSGDGVSIKGVGYIAVNAPTDWWNTSSSAKPSLSYNFTIYFNGSPSVSTARVYLPNNSSFYWTLDPSLYNSSTNSISEQGFWWTDDTRELPVGTMKAEVSLTDGTTLDYMFTMGIPGNKTNSGDAYAYSVEDETTPLYPQVTVPALQRATISSFQVSPTEIDISFSINGNNVNNGWIWFYDSSNVYIGRSPYFLDSSNGAVFGGLNLGKSFNNAEGQNNSVVLNNGQLFDSHGNAVSNSDFSRITHCRLVVIDGAQYVAAGKGYTDYDYKAISTLL